MARAGVRAPHREGRGDGGPALPGEQQALLAGDGARCGGERRPRLCEVRRQLQAQAASRAGKTREAGEEEVNQRSRSLLAAFDAESVAIAPNSGSAARPAMTGEAPRPVPA